METNNTEVKKESRKMQWAFIIILFLVNLGCLGLFIWGIVELAMNSGYWSDIKGGLLIGIDLFVMLTSLINISSFLTNNPQYKQDFINFFKRSKKEKKVVDNKKEEINKEEQHD